MKLSLFKLWRCSAIAFFLLANEGNHALAKTTGNFLIGQIKNNILMV
jgi:hypothetical protein